MACIRVEIDIRKGLYESMEMIVGGRPYTRTLYYLNIPLWCAHFHNYGNVLANYEKRFHKQIWKPKR